MGFATVAKPGRNDSNNDDDYDDNEDNREDNDGINHINDDFDFD